VLFGKGGESFPSFSRIESIVSEAPRFVFRLQSARDATISYDSGKERTFMPTVRISGNWRKATKKEWAGAPQIDKNGKIDRSIAIPEEAFLAIQNSMQKGGPEGTVYLKDGTRFDWFLDR
jgi:hypothetical protein